MICFNPDGESCYGLQELEARLHCTKLLLLLLLHSSTPDRCC
jgi:hypothetical protein